jgi:hypothetical protein
MAAHGSAATGCLVERNLMRHLILGSLAIGTLALVIGCGTKNADTSPAANNNTESKKDADDKAPASAGEKLATTKSEARVEATWEGKLKSYMEPASAAATTGTPPSAGCAVAGRVRLFLTEKGKPQETDGSLTVMLYDCSPDSGLAEPLRIQEWHFEGELLKYFHAENDADSEYSFVLPWNTYKKDMTNVRIDVKYEPKTGSALTTKGEVLTLDHSEMTERTEK